MSTRRDAEAARRDWMTVGLASLGLLAWVFLWRFGASLHGAHAGAGSAWPLADGAVFVGSWTLMTVAMMLPTTLPLVRLFRRMTSKARGAAALAALLVLGYLAVWIAVGTLSWAGVLVVRGLAPLVPGLASRAGLADAALLLVAGGFQFSELKYRCLEQCRSPMSFIAGHWRGRRKALEALELGVQHGLFCVGCCWALMLLMFAAGANAVAWMLALAAVMGTEKIAPWGGRLVAPVGAILIAWGTAILASISISG